MRLSTRVIRGRVVTLAAGAKVRKRPSGNAFEPTRRRIFERDRHLCRIGLAGCTRRATVIHHIVAIAQGGDDSDSNLCAACAHCNGKLGDR